MRSYVRAFIAGVVVAVGLFARPTWAETVQVDHRPDGVVGEGAAMFGGPDERTGAMSHSIPIELPAARGLPQPRLALKYNSSWQDREAGYGWGLDLPVIERLPLSGFPEFAADGTPLGRERYAFSGKLLVWICQLPGCPPEPNTAGHPDWANGWHYYRPQVEGLFARFYRSADRKTWRVVLKGGERLEFGRLLEDGGGIENVPAYETDATEPEGIVRWQLAAQKDPLHPKNVVVYRWNKQSTVGNARLALSDIYYTPALVSTPVAENFAHHVQLDWQPLPYAVPTYLGVDRIGQRSRLSRIAVASKRWDVSQGGNRQVVRAYQLRYLADRTQSYDAATMAPLFRHSFLREVQLQGRCDEGLETDGQIPPTLPCPTLPPMRFEYEPGVMRNTTGVVADIAGPRETVLEAPQNSWKVFPYPHSVYITDFNRDGLPDAVQGWEPSCNIPADTEECGGCGGPIYEHGMKIAITPQGDPQLWCRTIYSKSEDCHTCGTTLSEYRVRSARPIIGYLNGGPTATAPLSLKYQCMDAGNGSPMTIPWINDGTTTHEHIRFLVPGGATVFGAAGNAIAFWEKDDTLPIVARPLSQPTFAPGTAPSNSGLGGCFLDDRFDKANFFPRWSWEAHVNGTDFVYRVPAKKPVASDSTANEPAWFVDVDGDGFADKLIEDTVHTWDLFNAKIAFTRHFQPGEALPSGASGGSGGGTALIGFTSVRTIPGAIVPARKVRFIDNEEPLLRGVPTKFWYADVNGDGIQDFITSTEFDGTPLVPRVRPGNGRGAFACLADAQPSGAPCVDGGTAPDYYEIQVLSTSKPWVVAEYTPSNPVPTQSRLFLPWHFADVTGDGLADIVLERFGKIYVWVNLDGHQFGCFSSHPDDPCIWSEFPAPPEIRLTFADMNADGVNDIVAITHQGVTVASIYQQTPAGAAARAPRPGLLVRIDNGLGATTKIEYRSIQELDLDATSNGEPWTHHSPVPANVVVRMRTTESSAANGMGVQPKPFDIQRGESFTYRDPAYDRWKRQFVGFRKVARRADSDEAVTETTFWFGPCERDTLAPRGINDPVPTSDGGCPYGSDDEWSSKRNGRSLVGRPVRVDRYVPDRAGHSSRRYQWSKFFKLGPIEWLYEREHSVTRAQVEEVETYFYDSSAATAPGAIEQMPSITNGDPIERPPTQTAARRTRTRYRATPEWQRDDPYTGEILDVIDYGDEAGGDRAIWFTANWAIFSPPKCDVNWQCRTVDEAAWVDENNDFGTPLRWDWHELDARGNPERVRLWADRATMLDRRHASGGAVAPVPLPAAPTGQLSDYRVRLQFHYDADTGVVDEVQGAERAGIRSCTRFVLDPYRQFPRKIIQYKNGCDSADPLVTDLAFDRGFGVPVAKTAPDGGMSVVELDAFGRPTAIAAPDPASSAFTELVTSIDYVDQSPLSYVDVRHMTANFPTPSSVREVTLLNGLGEAAVTFSEDEGTNAWVASGWTVRDGAGRAAQTRRPFAFTGVPTDVASTPIELITSSAPGLVELRTDDFGRLADVRENGDLILRRTYGALAVEVRDKEQLPGGAHEGAFRRAELDGRGRIKRALEGPSGSIVTNITQDPLGRPTQITKSSGGSVAYSRTMTWDSFGQMVANTEPNTSRDGHVWRYVYDDDGRLIGTSDARGCGKNIAYDGLGRVVSEDYSPCLASHAAYAPSPEIRYEYDVYESGQVAPEPGFADSPELAQGRLVSLHDHGSHTRFNYDNRGRARRISRRVAKPVGVTPTMGDRYSDHWLAQRTDFDTANRVATRTSGADALELLVGGESFERHLYNARGLPRRLESSYGLLIDSVSYEPDAAPQTIVYGDLAGTHADFTYDLRRRLQTYNVLRSAPALWSNPGTSTYPAPDPRTTQRDLARFSFEYDGVGNPTRITDAAPSNEYLFDYAYPIAERRMRYDDLYRVGRVDYGYGPANGDATFRSPYRAEELAGDTRPIPLQQLQTRVRWQEFAFNALGNTTSTTDNLNASYDRSLGTIANGAVLGAGPNQLTSANGVQAAYDEAGNVIELRIQRQGTCQSGSSSRCAQLLRYDWDEVGQLVRARRWDFITMPPLGTGELPSVFVPGVGAVPIDPDWDIHYAYSGGGRVVKSARDSAGIETHTLDVFDTLRFDHVEFVTSIEDYNRDPRFAHLFLGGGVGHILLDPVMPYVISPVHRFINIGDHLGSGTITIDGETSELVERTTYQAFGALESDNRSPRWSDHREDLKFTGKEEDIEVGLTYFGARYYAPYLGRWASADPLTIHGLGADLNPYAYVSGRVMRDVDPFGLEVPPKDAKDVQHHGKGDYSYVAPDGTISFENYGIDVGGSNSLADAHFREAFADRLNDALMGHQPGIDIPLPGGGYVNQGDIGRATVNHVAQSLTPGWVQAAFRPGPVFTPSSDPRNKSGTLGHVIGTVIDIAGTAGIGAIAEMAGTGTLISGGGSIGGGGGGIQRALVPADLGLEGTDAIVQGTFRLVNGRAIVNIRYVGSPGGLGRSALRVWGALQGTARAAGATSLRVETTRIIESTGRLQPILEQLGFQARTNGTMFYEGAL